MLEQDPAGAPPRRLIVIAAAVAVVLAVGIAVIGLVASRTATPPPPPGTGPLPLPSVPAPQASSAECGKLLAALPATVTSNGASLPRRELAPPAPAATVAWGQPDPVVLRCGLERPPELTPTAQLVAVSGVEWLPVEGQGSTTWYLVDRDVYVALTVPSTSGTGPLQATSGAVSATLPKAPLDFG
jgi:uncharacterized protein DUF3515